MAGTRLLVARVVNSNPAHPASLTARGKAQACQLGVQLAGIDVRLAVATRLPRTQQTVELALEDRSVPLLIEPGLDEIDTGDWDGAPIEAYWDWKQHHSSNERFPHGETVNEALLRHASSLGRLRSRAEPVTLVVLHEFALRRIVKAVAGSSSPPDEHAVGRAAAELRASSSRRAG